MKKLLVQLLLFLAVIPAAALTGGEELVLDNRYFTGWKLTADMTDNAREEFLEEWSRGYDLDWEASYGDIADSPDAEGITFINTLCLHDIDIFYGREGFPEGRRSLLFQGNNYNLTYNNTLLQSDDYIYRKGSFRDTLSVFVNKKIKGVKTEASFYVKSGENLEGYGTEFAFGTARFEFEGGTRISVGQISPFFNIYTFDKRNTAIPGIEIETELAGTRVHLVAGRPDMPLDFVSDKGMKRVNIDAGQWSRPADVIYHFSEPFNYFEVTDIPVWVYMYSGEGGASTVSDITAQCVVTHSDVVIPYDLITPETQRLEIVYDRDGGAAVQQMYINAFDFRRELVPGLECGISYVDLHNDTHSVENTPGLTGPFDSNIWSLDADWSQGALSLNWQYAVSKAVPDDYYYEEREKDFIHLMTSAYETESLYAELTLFRMGADYLPNILSLRDKWKLFEDRDGDFLWNHEEEGMPLGTEGLFFRAWGEWLMEHELTLSYTKDLKSDYKTNDEYYSYDRFYLPYYSSVGNELYYYGEGIDDGLRTLEVSLRESFDGVTASLSYRREEDGDLVVTPLEKDTVSWRGRLSYENSLFFLAAEHRRRTDPVWYAPLDSAFMTEDEDTTTLIRGSFKENIHVWSDLFLKIRGDFELTYDRDSLYEEREKMLFRETVCELDFKDGDTAEYHWTAELLYRITDATYAKISYDREEFRGENSRTGESADYFAYQRGIKLMSQIANGALDVTAFYDEYELRFDILDAYDFSYKRVGLAITWLF